MCPVLPVSWSVSVPCHQLLQPDFASAKHVTPARQPLSFRRHVEHKPNKRIKGRIESSLRGTTNTDTHQVARWPVLMACNARRPNPPEHFLSRPSLPCTKTMESGRFRRLGSFLRITNVVCVHFTRLMSDTTMEIPRRSTLDPACFSSVELIRTIGILRRLSVDPAPPIPARGCLRAHDSFDTEAAAAIDGQTRCRLLNGCTTNMP